MHIPIEEYTLPNGLRVILSEDHANPVVAVNLWYNVGSRNEREGRTGFAHLFEHMMFQGSQNVPDTQHIAHSERVGGSMNGSTWLDRTNYFQTVPAHQLELVLWLESDRMGFLLPAMTQEKLDNQRDVVKNERRWSVDNQPYGTWDEKLQELVYPEDHPYHHSTIGSMEDLSAASLDDVRHFFATYYAPNNAVLTVAGDFEPDAALAAIERQYGPIPANSNLPPPPDMTLPPLSGGEVREVVEERVPLPRIYAAYRIPTFGTDGWLALEVAADLLGNGRASRLYRSLVREKRLAQDVTVFTFPLVGGASMFALWATASPNVDHDELERELFAEIDRLREDGPSDDELERVRNLQAASVESSLERLGERADRLSMYTILFDEPERINVEVSRYAGVGAAAVRAGMTEFLRPENRVVLTYLPAALSEPAPEVEATEIAEQTLAEADA
jgi:predicted Zn-dependent peptidase